MADEWNPGDGSQSRLLLRRRSPRPGCSGGSGTRPPEIARRRYGDGPDGANVDRGSGNHGMMMLVRDGRKMRRPRGRRRHLVRLGERRRHVRVGRVVNVVDQRHHLIQHCKHTNNNITASGGFKGEGRGRPAPASHPLLTSRGKKIEDSSLPFCSFCVLG